MVSRVGDYHFFAYQEFTVLVQSKAIAGAKSFGSFLYSAVNKAGKTVSEAGAKIKKTVEENVIYVYIFFLLAMLF